MTEGVKVEDPVPVLVPEAEAVIEALPLAGPLTLPELLGLAPLLKEAVGEAENEELRLLLLEPVPEEVGVGV